MLLGGLYVGAAAVAPLPSAAAAAPAQATITGVPVAPAWPNWPGASAAVGAVGRPGLLASTGSDASRPIASMTKTITALVVLDRHPLAGDEEGPLLTFGDADVAILQQVLAEDGSWAPVVAGEQLTERQALEAMMLPSANNYAISLANWAYGSVPQFVAAANTWLSVRGFSHTRLADAAGLDPGSVSNPRDLVGIGELALQNPVLADIVSTKQVTLPGAGELHNSNRLLGQDGVNGVKTGWTDQAGHCLLFAAKTRIGGKAVQLVGVVLGAPTYDDLFAQVPPLIASITAGYHEVGLDRVDLGGYTTAWGQRVSLRTTAPASTVVFSDSVITVTVRSGPVQQARPGQTVGAVTFGTENGPVSRPLTVSHRVDDPGLWWRVTHPVDLFL